MGRPRGIKPSTVTLTLSDGDTIIIHDRLTAGQERDITSRSIRGYTQGEDGRTRIEPDGNALSFATAATYILGWSFVDHDGKPIAWLSSSSFDEKVKILRQLDTDTLREIDQAIEAHRKAQQAAREGNATSEGTGPAVPSPSAA